MGYHNCLEELIKIISFPTLVFDENNKVVLRNTAESSSCQWAGDSPVGKTFFDFFPNDQASLLHDACQNAIDLKRPTAHIIRLIAQEGLNATATKLIPFFNPDNNSWCMIFLIEDQSTIGMEKASGKICDESISSDEKSQSNVGKEVEDAKAALRFLLKQGADQLSELKEKTFKDLANQLLPYVESLKCSQLNDEQLAYIDLLESNIRKFSEPFMRRIYDPIFRLSPSEVKVASMVRGGKSNKEIAKILKLSKSTILTHRHHLRAKLGLKNKKQNLRSFLGSLGPQPDTAIKKKPRKIKVDSKI
jgi:DNA-binding CsgD family transcriptional regulator